MTTKKQLFYRNFYDVAAVTNATISIILNQKRSHAIYHLLSMSLLAAIANYHFNRHNRFVLHALTINAIIYHQFKDKPLSSSSMTLTVQCMWGLLFLIIYAIETIVVIHASSKPTEPQNEILKPQFTYRQLLDDFCNDREFRVYFRHLSTATILMGVPFMHPESTTTTPPLVIVAWIVFAAVETVKNELVTDTHLLVEPAVKCAPLLVLNPVYWPTIILLLSGIQIVAYYKNVYGIRELQPKTQI